MKTASNPAEIHVIQPNAVYFPEDLRRLFKLRANSIRYEKRSGRLKVSRRCGRYYILGRWLIEWLEKGEQPAKKLPSAAKLG